MPTSACRSDFEEEEMGACTTCGRAAVVSNPRKKVESIALSLTFSSLLRDVRSWVSFRFSNSSFCFLSLEKDPAVIRVELANVRNVLSALGQPR